MEIVYLKKLQDFAKLHVDAKDSILTFKQVVENAMWKNSLEVLRDFPKAKILDAKRARFKIRGNKYRVVVDYRVVRVTIRFIGTHKGYDEINVLIIKKKVKKGSYYAMVLIRKRGRLQ